MRKKNSVRRFMAAALVTLAAQAAAQNTYQAQQFRLDSCEIVAKRASNAYKFRQANATYPMHMISGDDAINILHRWVVNYAMTGASSSDDAIRTSFSKCMDNIDRVYRDQRAGRVTQPQDLQ